MKKIHFCFIIFSLILISPTFAELTWQRSLGFEEWDEGYCVQQTNDNGFIIVGHTGLGEMGYGNADIYLLKTDFYGNQEGYKIFSGEYGHDFGYYVVQTTDSGYALVGSKNTLSRDDIWLIKTNTLGEVEWEKTFDGPYDDDGDSGYCIQQTTDNGYIIVGVQDEGGPPDSDIWLIKTDAYGNEEWNQVFGGSYNDEGKSVKQTIDGGYILTGAYGDEFSIFLIKTDALGNQEWIKIFNEVLCKGESVVQTSDGGYFITGTAYVNEEDVMIIKTDANGNKEWSQIFGTENQDEGFCGQQTSDGGYIVTGSKNDSQVSLEILWLIKVDSYGNMEWEKSFGGIAGDDRGRFVEQISDGGYIISGRTSSYNYYGGLWDLWLIYYHPEKESAPLSTTQISCFMLILIIILLPFLKKYRRYNP